MMMKQETLFNYRDLPKNSSLQSLAKQLRKAGNLAEVLFWQNFKNKKLFNWDIDRQIIIGDYIVDFMIPELGLVIEIDGYSHTINGEHDAKREQYLTDLRLSIIHLSDKQIRYNIDEVKLIMENAITLRIAELSNGASTPARCATPQEGN